MTELSAEIAEHDVVMKTLEPMDATRKCFRLVGEVLVERTVGEVLPAVKKNRDNLESFVQSLQASAEQQETELADFQAKYKIRIVREDEEESDDRKQEMTVQKPGSNQGVLVSK
ncbi:hypothetical protein CEUSTIGMA_g2688.t1 [Chlamydomonas eustigma]|uniref:Prefoldin subunit 2 n=1 Tax=Chlamydomonas eustigma TaxID=1157962 RepID=A0A250WWL1_9CHLO|nr:hypothetical protein CEUSTIGMA_g2688.t1 [Chlamydomonas eustigma]|eukprot:GAX75243.1 hypothetical protein CEUSTIGMA_g2688.t1 [Chlamydomonas eustigma]